MIVVLSFNRFIPAIKLVRKSFFGSWAQIILEAKLKIPLIFEIHIYIDSESFRQIHKKLGGVGIFVIDTWPKWCFEIWPFLWFFWGPK